jgi:hypothetical protein
MASIHRGLFAAGKRPTGPAAGGGDRQRVKCRVSDHAERDVRRAYTRLAPTGHVGGENVAGQEGSASAITLPRSGHQQSLTVCNGSLP